MAEGEGNPELVLLNVQITPSSPQPGDQVTIIAEARNAGGVETGAFQARYRLESDSGAVQQDINWPNLYPGESRTEQWQVPLQLRSGEYRYSVVLDVYNQVPEQDKNDNSGGLVFEIGAPVSMQLEEKDLPEAEELRSGRVKVREDEEEVIVGGKMVHTNIGAGNTVQNEIMAQVHAMNQMIGNYWANYAAGLSNFETSMAFPPDQEVEIDRVKAILTSLFEQFLDLGLGQIAQVLGKHGDLIVSTVRKLVETELKSSIPAGSGKAKIANYIEDTRDNIVRDQQKMQAAIDYHALLEQYVSLMADFPDKGEASPGGNILGPGAQFIINLRAAREHLQNATPSIEQIQQRLTEAFAGMPVKEGGHYKLDGRLYFHLNLYNEGGKWEIRDGSDSRWTLVTSQPDAEGAAHSLHRALVEKQHKRPWDSELPKDVEMFIEVEETGNNNYADGHLLFAGSNTEPNDVRTNYSPQLFKQAWSQPDVQRRVMQASDIVGKSL